MNQTSRIPGRTGYRPVRKSLMIIKRSALCLMLPVIFALCACDSSATDSNEQTKDNLYVKFMNNTDSKFTITSIQLQAMGVAGQAAEPSGIWSDNILIDSKTINPGAHEFFNLDIPNSHWSQYRLGVDDGQGNEIMLSEQNIGQLPITHWGSDERTVSVTIVENSTNGQIIVTSWSDFAGID